MDDIAQKNADRFTGFSDTYESSRPAMPLYPVKIVKKYLGRIPDVVVDLGCGTGLSTVIWEGNCSKAIGIEPSDDMRGVAQSKSSDTISFAKAYAHDTKLADNSVDAAICSQSFHWMEPTSTLKEVHRILATGGVFAAVDCDWPPLSDWRVDRAYNELFKKIHQIEDTNDTIKDNFTRYEKDKHLSNIIGSGLFAFAREVVFSNTEKCDAKRLIDLTISQGSLQNIIKHVPELIADDIEGYKALVHDVFGEREFEIEFSYRMRIAVK
ncbi:MAG: methyltransferase domain-containing protein [Clostridia bacterium]|jgi:ubiquinone/menaquinone biosynthesis C-methylase UbiE|nr:methyltransferase domain-containing protein [Clostridia bacterium]MBT7121376.1 methyltransferase domain-containing protein [Clostridia bacterium]